MREYTGRTSGADRVYHEKDYAKFSGTLWNMIIIYILIVGLLTLTWLSMKDLSVDSYKAGNYALAQCWPRAGDWPEHGDDCE